MPLLARVLAYKQEEEEKAGGCGGVTLWGGGGRNGIEPKGAGMGLSQSVAALFRSRNSGANRAAARAGVVATCSIAGWKMSADDR